MEHRFPKSMPKVCQKNGVIQAMDATLNMMKRRGIPETREDYLFWAYLGNPPEELSAEEELALPRQFQLDPPEVFE